MNKQIEEFIEVYRKERKKLYDHFEKEEKGKKFAPLYWKNTEEYWRKALEDIALSARTELIKEIRDKMPKKQKDNLPDEIGGHKIDKEGFETFHRGFNSYHDELELILTKIDDEKHEK